MLDGERQESGGRAVESHSGRLTGRGRARSRPAALIVYWAGVCATPVGSVDAGLPPVTPLVVSDDVAAGAARWASPPLSPQAARRMIAAPAAGAMCLLMPTLPIDISQRSSRRSVAQEVDDGSELAIGRRLAAGRSGAARDEPFPTAPSASA